MSRRFALLAAGVLAVLALSGCWSSITKVSETSTVEASPTPPAAAPLKAMTIEEKQQLIVGNFQPEVPVPMGEVVRGNAQGDNAWDYELIVAAPPAAVAAWYQEAYTGRDWQLAEQTVPSEGAVTLTLVTNAAQTRVAITPEGADKSRVVGVLGIGAPVLQTQ